MIKKRVIGIIIAAVGIALLISALVIKSKVASGRRQIADARRKVDQTTRIFSYSQVTKPIGKEIKGYAAGKITEANLKADKYNLLANWFLVGGVVFVAVGGVVILTSRRK